MTERTEKGNTMKKQEEHLELNTQKQEVSEEVKIFANRIIDVLIDERKRKGMTQQEVADITGMKAPNITRIESRKYTPTLDVLVRYANAVGKELHFELVDKC